MFNSKLVAEKTERLAVAGRNQVPDRVPVTSQVETFAYAYGGTTIEEVKTHPFKGVNSFRKVYNDMYFDGFFEGLFVHPFAIFDALGADSYFASDDGTTAQHSELCPMEPEQYDALIENPLEFFINDINMIKFPNLYNAKSEEEIRKVFLNALKGGMPFIAGLVGGNVLLPLLTDTPSFFGGFVEMPCDNIFDYLRGFKNTVIDMRRRPDKVEEAVNKIYEEYTVNCEKFYALINRADSPIEMAKNAGRVMILDKDPKCVDFPWFFNPTHIPAFLTQAQYERFYWPTYKKTIEFIASFGGHVCSLLEGEWGEGKLELFKDLEPGIMTVYVENDDAIKAKKQIGDYQSIMGGMPMGLLKDGTKAECIDYAKKLVDECAPGGGYIFTTDKSVMSPQDIKVENMKAVNEFVHVYGQY